MTTIQTTIQAASIGNRAISGLSVMLSGKEHLVADFTHYPHNQPKRMPGCLSPLPAGYDIHVGPEIRGDFVGVECIVTLTGPSYSNHKLSIDNLRGSRWIANVIKTPVDE